MASAVLDTIVAAETPEGILLELRPAGLCARFYALALDWGVRLVVTYVVAIVTSLPLGEGSTFHVVTNDDR